MSVYVGIDVHRKRSQVAVIDQDGKVLANRNVNNGVSRSCRDRRPAVGHPRGFRGRVRLGMAGGTAGGLRLRAAPGPPAAVQGHRVGAAEERQGRRRDFGAAAARGPAAGGVDRAARQLRALLRHRAQLVRLRTLLQNRIHAVLADHGCDRPAGCWSGPGREWLASLELPAVSAEVMNDALALIDALESVTGRLDLEVRQHARSDPRVKILTRLPGVGPFTALVCRPRSATSPGSPRRASWRPGPGSPPRCAAATAPSGTGTSPRWYVRAEWFRCVDRRCAMAVAGGLDLHRGQLTFDYVDTGTGESWRGRICPADRESLRGWLRRFHGVPDVEFAVEGCTGWRYVAEELQRAGITPHLAEPAGTAGLRGRKRRAKTDWADARHLRDLLLDGRIPESWIPPGHVLEAC